MELTEVQVTVTRQQLHAAFLLWEKDNRNGECMDQQEVNDMSPTEAAELSVQALLKYLGAAQ